MKIAGRLYHLARADFYERVRRHGFLVALLFCVYAGYAFLPPNPSKYVTLVMDTHRGIYNSAWIGTAVAMLAAAFISLIGFFIVKNAVERDRRTGVGQILATTPISKLQYTLGKTLSNFAVLAAMTTIVALASVVMQFVRAEDTSFDAGKMFVPFVLITFPPLLITSALAVFFETMPVLRGGMGNVAFIFVWGFILGGNFTSDMSVAHNDPMASGIVMPDMFVACKAAFPDFVPSEAGVSMGINITDAAWNLTTFEWDGVDWTRQYVMWRLSWVLVALGIGAVAAIPFDRFDPSKRRQKGAARTPHDARSNAGAQGAGVTRRGSPQRATVGHSPREDPTEPVMPTPREPVRATSQAIETHLTLLPAGARRARFLTMVLAEWKLIVRGLRWWWIGPLGLGIAALTAPLDAVKSIVLPLSWFWPVLLWSKLGTREATHHTEPVFFSAPRPLSRQLMATWLAGVMLSVVSALMVALRLTFAGEWYSLVAWCAGAAFVPALALALGTWTRSGKAFEAIYTGLCYAVAQSAAPLDFMGAVAAAPRSNPAVFATITMILLVLALAGRQRRLRT